MNIYEELKTDHRKVLTLLDKLVANEKADADTWKNLVQQIRDELVPHSRAEEAILYNSLRDLNQGKEEVRHGYSEHLEAETLLRGLQVGDVLHVNWLAGAKKLRDALKHHIAEEENEIFTEAQRVFSEEEAAAMGEAFVQMKSRVREKSFVGNTVDMIANMMPLRFRQSVRKLALGGVAPEQRAV